MIVCQNIDLIINDRELFRQFNLVINEGEKILLFGPSGSGKTSLVHMLLGFKLPTQGVIKINNHLMRGKNIWSLRTLIAYLDQDASLGQGKVIEILEKTACLKSMVALGINREMWKKYLDRVFLEKNVLNKELKTLSGGERQRLALAIVIAMDRPIWILDEPTASLDKDLKDSVIRLVMAEQKRTIVIISHDEQWQLIHGLRKISVGSLT